MRRSRDSGQCSAEILLHLRRLDGFLKHHGLNKTAQALVMEIGLFFEAAHLLKLVNQERWAEAHEYLERFPALWGDDDGAATQYDVVLSCLAHISSLDWFALRGDEGGRAASLLSPPYDALRQSHPEEAQRIDMYRSMASQQARESLDWSDIKLRTSESVQELLLADESIVAAHAHSSGH